MKDLIDTWINNNEIAIRNIEKMLSSQEEYEVDFCSGVS